MMRLDYGFSGYQVPPIPRAARSARKRCLVKRKSDNNHMFSFGLLASVAGKLMSPQCDDANEQPAAAEYPVCKVVDEKHEEEKPGEFRDFLKSELVADSPKPKASYFADEIDGISRLASGLTSSYSSGVDDDCKLRLGIFSPPAGTEKEHKIDVKKDFVETRKMSTSNNPSLEEEWDAKPQVFVGSLVDSSSQCGSLAITRDSRVKFIHKDDDENLSGCNGFEDGKVPASSDAKLGGFKDGEQDYAGEVKDNEKPGMKNQKSLRDYPLKKRKLLDYKVGYEGTSNVHENGLNPTSPGVIPMTQTSPCGNRASLQSQVKLKIKSFRVPEMLIEMPETGTIGSLKRTVMEAITAVLGGGLQVGVVVQGKKIKDDAKTLLQMGISQSNTADALTFLLEPISPPPHLKRRVSEKPTPLSSFPALPHTMMMITGNNAEVGSGSSANNLMESDHDSAHSSPGKKVSMAQSKALVPLRKSSKSAQRRIRRPFTVAEVEALVLAVEKLGTGRWRDVKLRAFDNSKHRTYVDLKDKWKTLVHTARISPQQRRGEQVPQELLDRVLAAHALWSQQQPKHHVKPQPNTFLRI